MVRQFLLPAIRLRVKGRREPGGTGLPPVEEHGVRRSSS